MYESFSAGRRTHKKSVLTLFSLNQGKFYTRHIRIFFSSQLFLYGYGSRSYASDEFGSESGYLLIRSLEHKKVQSLTERQTNIAAQRES